MQESQASILHPSSSCPESLKQMWVFGCRLGLGRMSPHNFSQGSPPSPYHPLTDTTSGSTTGSVDPWASPSQAGGLLLLNSNSKRAGSTMRGRRSRNSSAAFEELAKLRGAHVP